MIGQILKNRYQVVESIGRGGMADVYKVYDEMRATHLAMKVLREDLARDRVFLRRFQREAQALAKLQHRHIVRFYGLEQEDLDVFMLMDFIEGESLRDAIFRANRPLDQHRIMDIIKPVCSALHYAHQMGMLHCDIKPGNILLAANGEVLLTDFGIARMSDSATATLVGAGTPAYMAPELVKGLEPTPQTDIYALGVVLYEMFTGGERPFTGEKATVTGTTAEKVRWEQVNLAPTPPSNYNTEIPLELEQIVIRCLQKESALRFASCLELLNALNSHELHMVATPQKAKVKTAQLMPQKLVSTKTRPVGEPMAKKPPASAKTVKVKPPAPRKLVSPQDGMHLVYVPAGEFIMGSDTGDRDEQPAHKVFLDAYWIDQTPVTNAMFTRFLNAMQETDQIDPVWMDPRSSSFLLAKHRGVWQTCQGYEHHPVVCISWFGARAYSQWIGRRLPTEAEWEKAARGTDGRMYPWGNQAPNPELLNYDGNMGGTTPVGSYPQGASPYGALDMAGNVWEWMADWYDADYYRATSKRNPRGPSSGAGRVQRGGAWDDGEWSARVIFRDWDNLDYRDYDSGFRCAMNEK
jgi:serine/threonine-protein kinase